MKTMLVTGAAQGIGLATARHYAAQGWFVGMYDINREGVKALLESGEFPNACGDYCDVTDLESISAMIGHFRAKTNGRLDLLVNNAGGYWLDKLLPNFLRHGLCRYISGVDQAPNAS